VLAREADALGGGEIAATAGRVHGLGRERGSTLPAWATRSAAGAGAAASTSRGDTSARTGCLGSGVERGQFEDAEGGGRGGAGGGRERGREGESCERGERPASEGEGGGEREAGEERAEGYGADVEIGDGGDGGGGGAGGGGAGAAGGGGAGAGGEGGSIVSAGGWSSGRRVRSQLPGSKRQREKKKKKEKKRLARDAEAAAAAEGAPAKPGAGHG
jgi:hypothetical protein